MQPRPITVPCQQCPLRRLEVFRPFSETELAFIAGFKAGELNVAAGHDLLLTGNNSPHVYTLLRGWAFRYVLLEDGRRQILNFVLPGDFLGLQTSVFEVMEHSVQALTDVQLCLFPRARLWDLYREQPGLGFDVTWLAAHEESLVDENLASVGQRSALERMAFLILHIVQRIDGLGLVRNDACEFPLTQQHIADAMGLSLVHTNKTLRRLVRDGYAEIGGGKLRIRKRRALERLAGQAPGPQRLRPLI
ncbi:MAG TPA: Crp/Fnr family transcriptional regulator [Geminicoccaceae bacterium]|nr:Crp/Fnr family transcriptional regulator [Geminicoccus sp.]HMU51254.1 Crp/Fnr family transcriptional regulator [Geminicoccaceae bacterium]